jgi:hypothetical protein
MRPQVPEPKPFSTQGLAPETGSCEHRLLEQGDHISWVFETPSGRYDIIWCKNCGAIKAGPEDDRDLNCWERPADRIERKERALLAQLLDKYGVPETYQ